MSLNELIRDKIELKKNMILTSQKLNDVIDIKLEGIYLLRLSDFIVKFSSTNKGKLQLFILKTDDQCLFYPKLDQT